MFETLLKQANSGELDKKLALRILTGARNPVNALKLFELASRVRNETIGPNLFWAGGGIRAALPCKIEPRCKYCTFYSRDEFKLESIIKSVKKMDEMGLKQIHLVGGGESTWAR